MSTEPGSTVAGSFSQLEASVSGGFTGTRLSGVTVRPGERTLEFALEFPAAQGEAVRVALIRVSEVAWIEFEPRDPKAGGKKVTMAIESTVLDAAAVGAAAFPAIPAGGFAHRLHAQGTDGALCFAAGSAALEWRVEPPAGSEG
ncbi:MAG: hypothetical protein ABL977_12990 [Candidatus Eisenbacteria bacterium]